MTRDIRSPLLMTRAIAIPRARDEPRIVYDDARMMNVTLEGGVAVHSMTDMPLLGDTKRTDVSRETTDDS